MIQRYFVDDERSCRSFSTCFLSITNHISWKRHRRGWGTLYKENLQIGDLQLQPPEENGLYVKVVCFSLF